jgi:hypothetical protein
MYGTGFPANQTQSVRRLNILPLLMVELVAALVAFTILSLIETAPLNGIFAGILCGADATLESNGAPIWPELRCAGPGADNPDNQTLLVALITFGVSSLFLTPIGVLAAFLTASRTPIVPQTPSFPTTGVTPAAFIGQPPAAVQPGTQPPGTPRVFTTQTYVIDGKTYSNLDELPPEMRQSVQQAMGMLGDANQDGIPDFIQDVMATGTPQQAPTEPAPLADRLRKLDELRAAGLINEQEYQAKRAQILGEV